MVVGAALSLAIRQTLEPVRGIHRAVSSRWFRRVGPLARPVEVWHDTVSSLVYGSIRVGAALAGQTIDAMRQEPTEVDIGVRSVVCGLWGDDLGRAGRSLSQPMILVDPIADGQCVERKRVVILVHGLMQSERCWKSSDGRPGLASVLRERAGVEPVAVRFNTGRSIGDNGILLSELLEESLGRDAAVESIDVIGHSMGGLVARATAHEALGRDHRWVRRLGNVITLGTPHGGAPIEKGLHGLSRALDLSDTSRPLADFLNRRSAGIKDLRHGTVTRTNRPDHVLPPIARTPHRYVAGVVTTDPQHPVGWLAGDLLVRRHSAEGGGLSPADTALVPGTTHAGLLHHPEVAARILRWMGVDER